MASPRPPNGYFCHACNRRQDTLAAVRISKEKQVVWKNDSFAISFQDFKCSLCDSEFIEELTENSDEAEAMEFGGPPAGVIKFHN